MQSVEDGEANSAASELVQQNGQCLPLRETELLVFANLLNRNCDAADQHEKCSSRASSIGVHKRGAITAPSKPQVSLTVMYLLGERDPRKTRLPRAFCE